MNEDSSRSAAALPSERPQLSFRSSLPSSSEKYEEPTVGIAYVDEKLDMIADMTVKKPWRSLCACYGIIVVVIVWGVYLSGAIVVPSGFYEW
jgi:hypothetical protein